MYSAVKAVLKQEELRLLKEFVAERFGLVIDHSKDGYLSREIDRRLKMLRCSSFADYYALLKFDPTNLESRTLVSLLTNNETSFFREEPQLKVFSEKILPHIKKKKLAAGTRRITVVSAGCSSGEEVYTLAMLLHESGLFIWDWDVKVIGIDVDEEALAKAGRGVYSGRAFQTTPPHIMDRYFTKCAEGLYVRDMVRKITTFTQGNLLNLKQSLPEDSVDVIFCRNVLIYFNDATVKEVVESFSEVLNRDGMLFLGHSESLARITDHYLPLRFPGTIIYKKREGHQERKA